MPESDRYTWGMATTNPPSPNTSAVPRTGGRGARERILRAAGELFYERGIHATGVAALVESAHVSTRTFYQQFGSKNALVEAYLNRFEADGALESELQLERADLPPAERLIAIFDPLEAMLRGPAAIRGCPFHNAAVEAAGEMPEAARIIERHKRGFLDRLSGVAAEAGVADADSLARQLAVLYEGANALAASCNDPRVVDDARTAATVLLNVALGRAHA
jgi:AcrR family transcriptional regulator